MLFRSLLTLDINEDKAPTVSITKPSNDNAVIIDGQNIEVLAEAIDDLGPEGIDRVVFYVNGQPALVTTQSLTETTGSYAQQHTYRASIPAPEGVDGFVVKAVAYDVLGQPGESSEVLIGRIQDTVRPRIEVLSRPDGGVLTTAEPFRFIAGIEDVGPVDSVYAELIREYQDPAGKWVPLAQSSLPLYRDDQRAEGDTTPISEPDNHYYVYWADFADGGILKREGMRNERVRAITTIETPAHTVKATTTYEVGEAFSRRQFIAPQDGDHSAGRGIHYGAVDQYRSDKRTGGMVAAWSTINPMFVEQGLGVPAPDEEDLPAFSGLYLMDVEAQDSDGDGNVFLYSGLLNGAAEIFRGTIGEIKAEENALFASKSGALLDGRDCTQGSEDQGCPFVSALSEEIKSNWLGGDSGQEGSGELYLENVGGELLIFNQQNGDYQFGLPYLLTGRIDMPYSDVYGLDRKDDLAFVANGFGGVQVIDISDLQSPYHVGYIKPNGFARDVVVGDRFAYIAASHEGVVVADITDPAMPVVAILDTLGVANRLKRVGERLFVTDMAGDGGASQLNVVDISDPYHPSMQEVIELYPSRPDLVADGAYDVEVAGNKAYITVHYSDQEDKPAQSLVEVVDLGKTHLAGVDASVPAMTHRVAVADDFAARGVAVARGAIQVAAGKKGVDRLELSRLSVVSHTPGWDEQQVNTSLDTIHIELSGALPPATDLASYLRVLEGHELIGVDISDQFDVRFASRNGEPDHTAIELVASGSFEFKANTHYAVTVLSGLTPVSGQALSSNYQFSFTTSVAGDASGPDIISKIGRAHV